MAPSIQNPASSPPPRSSTPRNPSFDAPQLLLDRVVPLATEPLEWVRAASSAPNTVTERCACAAQAQANVASSIICRSGLAIEAHRGVASLANKARYGQEMRLALRSDGCAQPPPYSPYLDQQA